jgi:hypothetical protein
MGEMGKMGKIGKLAPTTNLLVEAIVVIDNEIDALLLLLLLWLLRRHVPGPLAVVVLHPVATTATTTIATATVSTLTTFGAFALAFARAKSPRSNTKGVANIFQQTSRHRPLWGSTNKNAILV